MLAEVDAEKASLVAAQSRAQTLEAKLLSAEDAQRRAQESEAYYDDDYDYDDDYYCYCYCYDHYYYLVLGVLLLPPLLLR